jgi:glucose dehydrogenase
MAPFPFWWIKGTPGFGGPSVTASGLIFITGAGDNYLRAFDIDNGDELWKGRLPTAAPATPMTYRLSKTGRQFVVIAAGGHWGGQPGSASDHIMAFALP